MKKILFLSLIFSFISINCFEAELKQNTEQDNGSIGSLLNSISVKRKLENNDEDGQSPLKKARTVDESTNQENTIPDAAQTKRKFLKPSFVPEHRKEDAASPFGVEVHEYKIYLKTFKNKEKYKNKYEQLNKLIDGLALKISPYPKNIIFSSIYGLVTLKLATADNPLFKKIIKKIEEL